MLLFIDNFDSFTYNIVDYFQQLGVKVHIVRGNSSNVTTCQALSPRYLVIGPGPGTPSQAILSKQLILKYAGKIPILGVCLGHQAIAECYGGKILRMNAPMHGKISTISHNNTHLFQAIPQKFTATRYHSLIVESHSTPNCLEISAITENNEVMGLRHRDFPLYGVQFHPEAILTQHGLLLFQNFLNSI